MKRSLRARLALVAGATGVGLVIITAGNLLIGARVEQQLLDIQNRHVPLIESGPRLEATFDELRRSFQDAVLAQDPEALEATEALESELARQIEMIGETVDQRTATELREVLDDYFASAYDVSGRLIAGETGLAMVDAVADMQTKQLLFAERVRAATAFDRQRLEEVFSSAADALRTASRLGLAISLVVLGIVIPVSVMIGRGIVVSIGRITAGLDRFGAGDFTRPIGVASDDELGTIATQADHMAERIQELLRERGEQARSLDVLNARLVATNRELESFSYSVAHDLRAPLRSVSGFSTALVEDFAPALPEEAKQLLGRITAASQHMGQLIDGLLNLSRLARKDLSVRSVDLSEQAAAIVDDLRRKEPLRHVEAIVEPGMVTEGDPDLLHAALTNLLGNAWKFTSRKDEARVEFARAPQLGPRTYFVRDNGAGFDMRYAEKLFGAFQRLHTTREFEGTGIGLATVQRIVHRHGGRIWAESEPGRGATFYFTLDRSEEDGGRDARSR